MSRQIEVLPGGHLVAGAGGVVVVVAHRAEGAVTADSVAARAMTALLAIVRQATSNEARRSGRTVARLATNWLMGLENGDEDEVEFGVITLGDGGIAVFLHGGVTAVLAGAQRSEILRGREAGFTVDRVVTPAPVVGAGLFVDEVGGAVERLPARGVFALAEGTAPGAGAVLWFEAADRESAAQDVPRGGISAQPVSDAQHAFEPWREAASHDVSDPQHMPEPSRVSDPQHVPAPSCVSDPQHASEPSRLSGPQHASEPPYLMDPQRVSESSSQRAPELLRAPESPGMFETQGAPETSDVPEPPRVPETPGAFGPQRVAEPPGMFKTPRELETPGLPESPSGPETPGAFGPPQVPDVPGEPGAQSVFESPRARESQGVLNPSRKPEAPRVAESQGVFEPWRRDETMDAATENYSTAAVSREPAAPDPAGAPSGESPRYPHIAAQPPSAPRFPGSAGPASPEPPRHGASANLVPESSNAPHDPGAAVPGSAGSLGEDSSRLAGSLPVRRVRPADRSPRASSS